MPPTRHVSERRGRSFQLRLGLGVASLVTGVIYLHATTQRDIELERNAKDAFKHLYIAEDTFTVNPSHEFNNEATALLLASAALNKLDNPPTYHGNDAPTAQAQPSPKQQWPVPRRNHNSSTTMAVSLLKLHFTVSSDCTTYQRWQTLSQVHSARAVGQAGRFSWLVSGCTAKEENDVVKAVADHFPGACWSTHSSMLFRLLSCLAFACFKHKTSC
jgi:hypothetical protein